MTTTAASSLISASIVFHVGKGMTLNAAIDEVLGAGACDTLVSEIYDALRQESTVRQIRAGISGCDAYIAKESPRAADLRPAQAAKHLAFCYSHRANLLNLLRDLNA